MYKQDRSKFSSWERPTPEGRSFNSPSIEHYVQQIAKEIPNNEFRRLFINCFTNTLDTTVHFVFRNGKPDTYVITGDIEAMWLRDSTAQIWPYLRLSLTAPEIQDLIVGLIRKQTTFILIDPYANAFYNEPKFGIHVTDGTNMKMGVHERKWELDSLCSHLRLATAYWKRTGDISPFDDRWLKMIASILSTFTEQQRRDDHGSYFFLRETDNPTDTLSNDGFGAPSGYTGMINSSFRPSDDSCSLPFHIPSNLLARKSLQDLTHLLAALGALDLSQRSDRLAYQIDRGLRKYSTVISEQWEEIYCYEVDGLGNSVLMDDANVPSLLSLPYLEICSLDDPIYQSTREFILSDLNPFYFRGSMGSGVGSPHTGDSMIWPLALIVQALTSGESTEILDCLRMLLRSSAGTGLLHESFHSENPHRYSRAWFAWCNSLFGELVAGIAENQIGLLKEI
jgi:meiotically up-regulated gene 157 (Mug157) protein